MDICSLGETFGVSRKLCQYTDPIEAVHSNLSPCLTYFGLMRNVRPKADVSSFSPRTLSTMGLCSINWPINCNEKLWLSMKSLVKNKVILYTYRRIFAPKIFLFIIRIWGGGSPPSMFFQIWIEIIRVWRSGIPIISWFIPCVWSNLKNISSITKLHPEFKQNYRPNFEYSHKKKLSKTFLHLISP